MAFIKHLEDGWRTVVKASNGTETYNHPPDIALVLAYAQMVCNDKNTWQYKERYQDRVAFDKPEPGRDLVINSSTMELRGPRGSVQVVSCQFEGGD